MRNGHKNTSFKSSSSLSCQVASTDHLDPLSLPVSILYCSRGASRLYPVSAQTCCISVLACPSIRRGPQEYIAYEFFFTSPAVFRMYGSSNCDCFRDVS